MADIDIVVTNYKTPNDLDLFCSSLSLQEDVDYTLTIANVSPTRRDIEVAGEWETALSARYVHFSQNVGYGRASNYGASLGDSPIVALFNADVAFPAGQLKLIVRAMQEHPEWDIVGPRQVNSNRQLTHAGIEGTNKEPRFRAWLTTEDYTDTVECLSVMGAAYFVRRDSWNVLTKCELFREFVLANAMPAVGAFLPTPLYYEEMWTSLHARAHDMKVMYFGGATLIHEWHQSINRYLDRTQEDIIFARSRDLFRSCCRHHGIECE